MGIKYQINRHPSLVSEDIPLLPDDLKSDFYRIFEPYLQVDPHFCCGHPSHNLTGKLKNCRSLEIEFDGDPNAYRLVYRIHDKPAPRRVEIISFAKHDPAYEIAKERLGKAGKRK